MNTYAKGYAFRTTPLISNTGVNCLVLRTDKCFPLAVRSEQVLKMRGGHTDVSGPRRQDGATTRVRARTYKARDQLLRADSSRLP
jgi:hypothetical protein